ncbi:histidine phosphatase family protein [Nocardioides sp. URHA0032]|uniref:histidine phosphatase family protein n=1 Tax=Nocardioides sp. URHA0032 TaxID=1380388 RepID=UPI00048E72D7|nr:histidine phosphatase family protein [Nocardioides sp. URHA0032]
MATVILVRHGRTTANATGVLAGRLPGVKLDDTGAAQAARTAGRLAVLPLAGVVTSPLERCRQTARAIAKAQPGSPRPTSERGITECDYGDWSGRPIKELAKEKLWSLVQTQPSAAVFPNGEAMTAMQARAVAAVRRLDAAFEAEHGSGALWVAVSHGDVIKSVLADALGMHLDLFQRLHVDPASVSIVRYTSSRPYVLATNTHSGDLSWLAPPATTKRHRRAASTDAVVGGGAGPSATA